MPNLKNSNPAPKTSPQPFKTTLREVHSLIEAGHRVSVSTPDGFQPVLYFHKTPVQEVFRINDQPFALTAKHKIYDTLGNPIELRNVVPGSWIMGTDGKPFHVETITSEGMQETCDLTIDHDNHRYMLGDVVVSNCLHSRSAACSFCGHCSSPAEVKHVSGAKRKAERGADMIPEIEKEHRDDQIAQRILFEVTTQGGLYASMDFKWMTHALNRAVMLAGWDIGLPVVDSLIYEKKNNTRILYRIKDENFKSLMSGKTVYELTFNSKVVFNEELVARLVERMNHHTTKGWKVNTGKIVSNDFVLKNFFKYQLVTFRIDSRRVAGTYTSLKYIQSCIDHFTAKGCKYRKQIRISQLEIRNEVIQYTPDRAPFIKAGFGRTPTEVVLRVMMDVEEAHPLIWLAGFLAKGERPKSYANLSSAEIKVEGFYEVVKQIEGSLFDSIKSDASSKCPKCGGLRAVNIMSGAPFGTLPEEQNALLMAQYGPVCQECWAAEEN